MNTRLGELGLKALAAALVAAGLICVLLGYLGVRRNNDIVLQLPYLASGGVGGLALIALGAVTLVVEQMREQSRRAAAVTEALEEWKETALAELRAFLESATLELEVPNANHRTATDPTGVRN
jgi:multisubunit Na+/H+ antiporter MnhG subunit